MDEITHTLVVGGTRGMGKALAEKWGKHRHSTLSILGRRTLEIKNASLSDIRHYRASLNNPQQLRRVVKTIVQQSGRLHNLVFFQRYRDGGDSWKGEIAVSLEATKLVIESLANSFDPKRQGSIVVIGSAADHLVVDDASVGYHVVKAGLRQMVRYYAATLGGRGIRVNCVTPGLVLKEEAKPFYQKHKSLLNAYERATPLGRMASVEDVVHAIEFLCSASASFVTGQNIVVDGGLSLRWQGSFAKAASIRR